MILAIAPGQALAQTYRWVDEAGTVHYTQGRDNVAERYRDRATLFSLPPPRPAAPTQEPDISPPGGTRIPFTPGSPILVQARINGTGPVTLILDTGAESTMVTPLALWRLGISTRNRPRAELRGVTGTSQVDVVRVTSLEVGAAKVGPLVVLAHDANLKQADGLLGRDFLDHFRVTIDSAERFVTLAPK